MLCMHVGSDPERIRTIHACRHSTGIPVGQLRMPYHKARIEAIVVVIPETFRILYLTYHLRSRLFTGLCILGDVYLRFNLSREPFRIVTINFDKICQLGRVKHRLQGFFSNLQGFFSNLTSS